MKSRIFFSMTLCIVVCLVGTTVLAVDFPGRTMSKYQDVLCIEVDELYQEYRNQNVVIVDTRSQLEYDTIHIKGAVHIPVGSRAFESQVQELARKHPGKKISFY